MGENNSSDPSPRLAARAGRGEADDPVVAERLRQIAQSLGLAVIERDEEEEATLDAVLIVGATGLELREAGGRAMAGAVRCDFVGGAFGHRVRKGHVGGELLVKAVQGRRGERGLKVVDATAGLGRDAMVLALAGFEVTAIERSAVMAALLEDGLLRAEAEGGPFAEAVRQRMRVVVDDARQWLGELDEAERPDVVVLDPMFPPRSKSALVKKEMRVCRLVAGADEDAADVLAVARHVARRRVVVKRPAHAQWLGGRKPTVSRTGKSVRFDIYVGG